MKRIILTGLLVLLSASAAAAQAQPPARTRPTGDACHVYVVDLEKAEKYVREYLAKGDPKAPPKGGAEAGETVFSEFYTKIGEEETTTRAYPFPGSKLFVTASVFYTDESMRGESMMVGVTVAEKMQKDALWGENTSVAEVKYDANTDIVRAKQRLKVGGRLYVVGVECRCNAAGAR